MPDPADNASTEVEPISDVPANEDEGQETQTKTDAEIELESLKQSNKEKDESIKALENKRDEVLREKKKLSADKKVAEQEQLEKENKFEALSESRKEEIVELRAENEDLRGSKEKAELYETEINTRNESSLEQIGTTMKAWDKPTKESFEILYPDFESKSVQGKEATIQGFLTVHGDGNKAKIQPGGAGGKAQDAPKSTGNKVDDAVNKVFS